MIKIQGKLDRALYVGVSGGVDSMVALDFLRRAHTVCALVFDHGTEYHVEAEKLIMSYCKEHDISVIRERISDVGRPKDLSQEEYWRNKRYEFLNCPLRVGQVVTAHHLDDVMETWIWSSMHGQSKLIPYRNGNVIRPFRLTKKSEIGEWAVKHNVPYLEDMSNYDTGHMRNYIRHKMVHHALHVNPGLYKVLRKKLAEDFQDYTCKEQVNSLVS